MTVRFRESLTTKGDLINFYRPDRCLFFVLIQASSCSLVLLTSLICRQHLAAVQIISPGGGRRLISGQWASSHLVADGRWGWNEFDMRYRVFRPVSGH